MVGSDLELGTIYKVTLISHNETALLRYYDFDPSNSVYRFQVVGTVNKVEQLQGREALEWDSDMFPYFKITKATKAEIALWSISKNEASSN